MKLMTTTADAGAEAALPGAAASLEGRDRWRAFGLLAADLLFEADAENRITFLAPDRVLGWPATELLGESADALLSDGARRNRVWLRTAAGDPACMAITTEPLLDAAGRRVGTRGVGLDVTAQARGEADAAAALRRAEVLNRTLDQVRQERTAPHMIEASLGAAMRATGARGAALLDLADAPPEGPPAPPWPVLHQVGEDPLPVLADALTLLEDAEDGAAATERTPGGFALLACAAATRFGDRAGLLVWRDAGGPAWDGGDRALLASVAGLARMMLEHEAIQRQMAMQARTDPLTGLLNRRAFTEDVARRLDRLDREELPGTLMVLDLDRLHALNDRAGHGAGDAALTFLAELLRRTFRPTDLVARLGGDEFAVWLDGSDEMTAAERAEGLRLGFPRVASHLAAGPDAPITVSVGIALRRAGWGETLDSLLGRAGQAVFDAKRAGPGHWRVSHAEPTP